MQNAQVIVIGLTILGTILTIIFGLFCYFLKNTYETVLKIKSSLIMFERTNEITEKRVSKLEKLNNEIIKNLSILSAKIEQFEKRGNQ